MAQVLATDSLLQQEPVSLFAASKSGDIFPPSPKTIASGGSTKRSLWELLVRWMLSIPEE